MRDEFNSKSTEGFERVRDYMIAHYKFNTRQDSDYWKACRDNMELSTSLRHILDVWYRRGDLSRELERQKLESHIGTLSWHCLVAGYGAFPPFAVEQPTNADFYRDREVEKFVTGCALNFAGHRLNLTRL